MIQHFPARPHWHCRTCGACWPCGPARQAMLGAAGTDGIKALRVSMLATQAEAESDFEQFGALAEHGDLHDRFVGWVPLS